MSRRSRLLSVLLTVVVAVVLVPGRAEAAGETLQGSLTCIEEGDDWIAARFSVQNTGPAAVEVPLGSSNYLLASQTGWDAGLPTSFPLGWTRWTSPKMYDPGSGFVAWRLGGRTLGIASWDLNGTPRCVDRAEVAAPPEVFGALAVGGTVAVGGEQLRLPTQRYDVAATWWKDCDTDDPEQFASGREVELGPELAGHRVQAKLAVNHVASGTLLEAATPCGPGAEVGLPPSAQAVPTISGVAQVGSPLSVDPVAWTGDTTTDAVSWEACDASGCTVVDSGATYTPAADVIGRTIRAVVRGTGSSGEATVTSLPTGPVAAAPTVGGGTAAAGSLSFADQPVAAISAPQRFVYTNDSGSSVQLRSAGVSGEQRGDFVVTARECAAGLVIAAGASCWVEVSFRPTWTGNRRAVLKINDGTSRIVTLEGTGTPGGELELGSSGLGWWDTRVRTLASASQVEVRNVGAAAVTVTAVVRQGHASDFPLTTDCVGAVLEPDEACTIEVGFKPRLAGTRTAVVLVRSNAAGGTRFLDLRGEGV